MRISTSQIFQSGANSLMDGQSKLYKLQNQLSSGKKFLSAQDDPVAAAQVLLSAIFICGYFAMLGAFMAGYVKVPLEYKDAFTAILGVLTGSMVALVLASVLVSWRARHYRRLERAGGSPAEEVAP